MWSGSTDKNRSETPTFPQATRERREETMAREQDDQRLHELGDFLRTRRNRIAPEDGGLPRGSRRRAPGLRRAEVAQLSGVSVDWYTWLEQGRPISVSTQVLESLVQALHLNADERAHLFFLAHQQPPPARAMKPETVSPALQLFLDHQGLSPAFVRRSRYTSQNLPTASCEIKRLKWVLSNLPRSRRH